MDRPTVETLIRDGKTAPVAGFFTRDGKSYSARLALGKQGQVQILPAKEGDPEDPVRTPDSTPLGTCPLCGKREIIESPEGYVCTEGEKTACAFKLPVRLCQRSISREDALKYITQGRTDILEGFISKRGNPFRATLVMGEKGKIDWEFPPREKSSGRTKEADDGQIIDAEPPLGSCPVCKKGKILTAENAYICREGEGSCSFRLPRIVLGREMTREEAEIYVRDGHTDILEGFTSRRNRPFRATLYLKKNGNHGFKFPPREG